MPSMELVLTGPLSGLKCLRECLREVGGVAAAAMMTEGMTGEMIADMMTAEVVIAMVTVTGLGGTDTGPDPGLLTRHRGGGPAAEVQAPTDAESLNKNICFLDNFQNILTIVIFCNIQL